MRTQQRFAVRGLLASLSLVIGTGVAAAQVTYVDADTMNQPATTNTTFADGSAFTPPTTTGTVPADNQFWERTGYANDSDIIAASGGSDVVENLRTTMSGLTPSVDYEVFVYYWWADTYGNGEWDISAGLTEAGMVDYLYTDGSAIPDPTTHFTDPTVMVVEGNRDMYELSLGTTTASATGTIDVYIGDYAGNDDRTWYDGVGYKAAGPGGPGTPFCFGNTAAGNPCPCGNDNDGSDPLGAGCQHDDSVAGARLGASGVASVTADTLLFEGHRGPVSNSSMFFQANNNQDGAGLFLGDGIRCAGGGLIRLKVKLTDATGYADSSPMVVTTRSASFGHPITAGETLYYQWWFRDVNGSPCGTESSTSNGYMITWAP